MKAAQCKDSPNCPRSCQTDFLSFLEPFFESFWSLFWSLSLNLCLFWNRLSPLSTLFLMLLSFFLLALWIRLQLDLLRPMVLRLVQATKKWWNYKTIVPKISRNTYCISTLHSLSTRLLLLLHVEVSCLYVLIRPYDGYNYQWLVERTIRKIWIRESWRISLFDHFSPILAHFLTFFINFHTILFLPKLILIKWIFIASSIKERNKDIKNKI